MWKIRILTFLLVSVFTSCLTVKPKTWKRFSPANEQFTVLIPDDAEVSNLEVTNSFTFVAKGRSYSILYFDEPTSESAKNQMETLANMPELNIGGNTTLISERRLTFNGYSGREFKYGNKIKRMLVVKSRLYIFNVNGGTGDSLLDRNAETFFVSFEVK